MKRRKHFATSVKGTISFFAFLPLFSFKHAEVTYSCHTEDKQEMQCAVDKEISFFVYRGFLVSLSYGMVATLKNTDVVG